MWDDRREILLMIRHMFELYAMHRRPLPACHKDTLRRLQLAYVRLESLGDRAMNLERHVCEHSGCNDANTTSCTVIAYKGDGFSALWLVETYGLRAGLRLAWRLWRDGCAELPPEWYCADHAKRHGYCWGCGFFWSGCESFDFDNSIFCPNCRENEYDEDFHDDEWLDLWEHYPGELLTDWLEFGTG